MQMIPRHFLTAAACAAVLFSSSAMADQVNTNSENVAIEGYDPVAYFTEARPVQGVPDFQSNWQDATWQFASAEHKSMFEENPEKYTPRFGGFCAGAMAVKGHKSEIDPQYWIIVDGNLFLGGEQRAIDLFDEDASAKINQADKNWKALN
jgi:YHS domain-containing protein